MGVNDYDGNQWTLRAEFAQSLTLYLTLMVTATFTPRWRFMTLLAMLVLSLHQPDLFYANVSYFSGAILADLSFLIPQAAHTHARLHHSRFGLLKLAGPVILALLGCYLGSYPEEQEDQMKWSHKMHLWGVFYLRGCFSPF